MIRPRHICLLLLILALAVASEVTAAGELEIFAGQDKTGRVNALIDFNDAEIIKPKPLDPDRTYTFSWDFDLSKDISMDGIYDNDAERTDQYTQWSYGGDGDYIVTLTVTDGYDTVKATLGVKVKANQAPDIRVNTTETAYRDVEYEFWAEAFDDNAQPHLLQWHWVFGDGHSTDGAPPVKHTFTSVRVYEVKVQVTDPEGKMAEKSILVTVKNKPGEMASLHTIKDGSVSHKGKQIREEGYIAYRLSLLNNHDAEVKVTVGGDSPPVAVLVFTSENAFLDYEVGVGGTWDGDLSHETQDYKHKITFKADEEGDYYIVIDNGYQTGGGVGSLTGMATVDVSIKDQDYGNWWVDIPVILWFIIAGALIAVLIVFVVNKVLEAQTTRKHKIQAIQATRVQKDQAVYSLRSFLDNPEDVVVRESDRAKAIASGPPPRPGGPPGAPGHPGTRAPGAPAAAPGGPPPAGRPMGPPGGPGAPPRRPPGAPGGQPPRGPPGGPPPRGPPKAQPKEPEAAPPEEPPAEEPPEEPPAEEAPPTGDALELISTTQGPAYEKTEQPKRLAGFELDEEPKEVEIDEKE